MATAFAAATSTSKAATTVLIPRLPTHCSALSNLPPRFSTSPFSTSLKEISAQLHNICNSPSSTRRRSDAAVGIAVSGIAFIFPTTLSNRSLVVLASKSQKDEANSSIKDPDPAAFMSQEDDLKYLLKLGGGSILGAAAIKYGSVLFPEITRPNILQALFMISAPIILSVILLIKKSRED